MSALAVILRVMLESDIFESVLEGLEPPSSEETVEILDIINQSWKAIMKVRTYPGTADCWASDFV